MKTTFSALNESATPAQRWQQMRP
jgi:hypothetical protein